MPFDGDRPDVAPGVVEALDTAGENVVTPGPLQGEDGRRYRVRLPVPTLDFGSTGLYRCEISVDTSFNTVNEFGRLMVVGK